MPSIEDSGLSNWYPAYLRRTDDGLFEIVVANSPVYKADWKEFLRKVSAVNDMRPFVIDFFCIMDALKRVRNIDSEISTSMSEGGVAVLTPGLAGIKSMAHAQLEIASYINTAWAFREHALIRFTDKFGKGSAEIEGLTSLFSELYDRSQSYRLLYDLRNYAQHYDMPISSINNQGGQNLADYRMNINCKVMLSVSELVSNPRVKKRMKDELRSMKSDQIDVVEICVEGYNDFCVIMRHLINKSIVNIAAYHAFYVYMFQNLKAPEGATIVFIEKGGDAVANGEKTNMCHTAFDELQIIIDLLESLPKSKSST